MKQASELKPGDKFYGYRQNELGLATLTEVTVQESQSIVFAITVDVETIEPMAYVLPDTGEIWIDLKEKVSLTPREALVERLREHSKKSRDYEEQVARHRREMAELVFDHAEFSQTREAKEKAAQKNEEQESGESETGEGVSP